MKRWVSERPHVKGLADKVCARFAMADEAYRPGEWRRDGLRGVRVARLASDG